MAKSKKTATKTSPGRVATNRKARHDYTIVDNWEAGIVLVGTEVKAIRDAKVSIVDSFATIDDGEVWLHNLYIGEYDRGSWTNHAPRRKRKLLLHKKEIMKLHNQVHQTSYTLVPLSLYFTGGKVKVDLALARGKQAHDKRHSLMEKQSQRDTARELGRKVKGMNY